MSLSLGGFEPQFPYHTCSNLQWSGGGFNLKSPATEQLATYVVSFFAGHHEFSVLGADRALHVRSPKYFFFVQPRKRYFYNILRRHQSGSC